MGTGFSIQTTVNAINNSIKTAAESSVRVNGASECTIDLEEVRSKDTHGCVFTINNNCSAISEGEIDNMIKKISRVFDDLTTEQKQNAASLFSSTFGVSTTVNNIQKDFEEHVKHECAVDSSLENRIKIKKMIFESCHAPPGQILRFNITNIGTARASCITKLVNDLAVDVANHVASKHEQGTDWTKFFWPFAIFLMVSSVGFIILKLFANKIPSPQERVEINASKYDNYAQRIRTLYTGRI